MRRFKIIIYLTFLHKLKSPTEAKRAPTSEQHVYSRISGPGVELIIKEN